MLTTYRRDSGSPFIFFFDFLFEIFLRARYLVRQLL